MRDDQPGTGESADLLRALGRFLDAQDASQVEIMYHPDFLAVSWQTSANPGQRAYRDHDLETLRLRARELRNGLGGRDPGGSLAEMLRTLGQELDHDGVDPTRIVQEGDTFSVSGVAHGAYVRQAYSMGHLLELSAQRRGQRQPARTPARGRWDPRRLPFLRRTA